MHQCPSPEPRVHFSRRFQATTPLGAGAFHWNCSHSRSERTLSDAARRRINTVRCRGRTLPGPIIVRRSRSDQLPGSLLRVGGSLPTMTVTTPSGALPAVPFALTGSIGIFLVENQDGSINSASNPARAGSVVTLFATGLGSPGFGSLNHLRPV